MSRKPTLAVFLVRYSLRSSPPVQEFIKCLMGLGRVDLYLEGVFEPLPAWLETGEVRIIRVSPGGVPASPVHADAAIAFDLEGLILCGKTLPDVRPLYYSLELYLPGEPHCAEDVFAAAKAWLPRIRGLIIQSKERAGIFLGEFKLPEGLPVFILPVTYGEFSDRERSTYLRRRYGIPADKGIVLHLGEVTAKYNAWNIARAFRSAEKWVLVFHGFCRPAYRKRMEERIRHAGLGNVYLSEEFCADFSGLREILLSADVGLAWYTNLSRNYSTAGWASAKIAAYYAHGVPVIGNALRSVTETVVEPGCGLTVRHPDEIPQKLEILKGGLEGLRETVRQRYLSMYRFVVYQPALELFVKTHALDTPASRVA